MHVRDEAERPVPRIALLLTLYDETTRARRLIPEVSNLDGVVCVDRAWVIRATSGNVDALADPAALARYRPEASLELMSREELGWAIAARQRLGSMPALHFAAGALSLQTVVNDAYEPQEVVVRLDVPGEVIRQVVLHVRHRATV